MAVRVDINKNILEWAILRAGYEIQEFLMRYPKVESWLNQTKKPTIKQLEGITKSLNVPFGYMFLQTPPDENLDFPFFRTGSDKVDKISLNVFDAVQIIHKRQGWLSEYLKDEGFDKLDYVGRFNEKSNYKDIVLDIRNTLELDQNWAAKHKRWEEALEHLTNQIEEVGVVINFSGIVGNNTKRVIDVKECRGFVLIDDYAPFMFINSGDAKAAQLFTLIHELAHIWIGHSAGFDHSQLMPANHPIELLCDQVAAEFLVPAEYMLKVWKESNDFKKIGRTFKVSPIVVARRAFDLKLVEKEDFFTFYNDYITAINLSKSKSSSGGNFYATSKKRISLSLASHIHNAVKENKLLYKDAYKITGLKGETYAKFIKEYLHQA